MSGDWNTATLTVVGGVSLVLGVGALVAPITPVAAFGLGVGSLMLAVLGYRRRSGSGRVSFPLALATAGLPIGVVVITVAAVGGSVLDWGGVVTLVFVGGLGLAFPLGVASTRREQSAVLVGLALLAELFVAAAVHDQNTHLEAEGIATMLAVAAVPVVAILAVPVYRAGGRIREAGPGDGRPRRPLIAATALPWVAGLLAMTVPSILDFGLDGLRYSLLAGGLGIPVLKPVLLVFLALGGAFVYGVHRATRPGTA